MIKNIALVTLPSRTATPLTRTSEAPAGNPLGATVEWLPPFAALLIDSLTDAAAPPEERPAAGGEGGELPADGSGLPFLAAGLVPVPLAVGRPVEATRLDPGGDALAGAAGLPAPVPGSPPAPLAPEVAAVAPAPRSAEVSPERVPLSALPGELGFEALAPSGQPSPLDLPRLAERTVEVETDPGQASLPSWPAPATGGVQPGRAATPASPIAGQLDGRWGEELGQRLTWMVRGDVQEARLRLDPPDLGPLDVRISVIEDEARISFVAPHAAVREAVEAALPRLREMFVASGLQLVQADVSGQGTGHRPPPEPPALAAPAASGRQSGALPSALTPDPLPRSLALLDVYA